MIGYDNSSEAIIKVEERKSNNKPQVTQYM
jgi:hypothetical protein